VIHADSVIESAFAAREFVAELSLGLEDQIGVSVGVVRDYVSRGDNFPDDVGPLVNVLPDHKESGFNVTVT
jgi:hypothetical protein